MAHRGDASPAASREWPQGADTASERARRVGIGDGADSPRSRTIRRQYRELISAPQQNREEMLSSKSNRLTEALEEANELFDRALFRLYLTTMGINGTEGEENGSEPGGFLPGDAWEKLGEEALKCLRRAPTFHYLAIFASSAGSPISFLNFVIDPNSFARTVENCFMCPSL
ncbi:EP300-interacting inhibitor of differentiation 3-like isoform X2 [Pithys albifrons albifrons]